MRQLRIRFRVASSVATPFQADTIFGHICWALRYIEDEPALDEFLTAYDKAAAPLLVSDGLPVVDGNFYLPRPAIPDNGDGYLAVAKTLGVDNDDIMRKFSAAWKALSKKPYIEASALKKYANPLDMITIAKDFFQLKLCPQSMALWDKSRCECTSWLECPALETGEEIYAKCGVGYPRKVTATTAHNSLNRLTLKPSFFVQEEYFPEYEFYFLVMIDDDIMSESRLRACLEFIEHSGYGRDKSTGKGAIKDLLMEEYASAHIDGANAFINLSSAYMPQEGQLGKGYYSTAVKRGKLGGSFAVQYGPWKRPLLMIEAGSVFEGDPELIYGGLTRNVHHELDKVVQYGYAYPLGVRLDAEAL